LVGTKLYARPTAGDGCVCATELMEDKDQPEDLSHSLRSETPRDNRVPIGEPAAKLGDKPELYQIQRMAYGTTSIASR
jgi:hypothetical protein